MAGDYSPSTDPLRNHSEQCTTTAVRLSHGDQAPPLASRGDLDAKGDDSKHRPTPMEKNPCSNHQAPRDWADCRTLPKLGNGSQRLWMNGKLAIVRNGLDYENPGVSATKATA